MSILVIDIAAIPDVEMGERLYGLHDLSEKDITRVMYTKSREKDISPGDLEHHLQKVLAISLLIQDEESFKIIALGDQHSSEIDLLQQLQQEIERHKPMLITWNGTRSVLPLLHCRYFSNCIQTPFKNDINHTDLKNELTANEYQSSMTLHEAKLLAGFPGTPQMTPAATLDAWLAGNIEQIRNDKLVNVVNIWLVYQRLRYIHGEIDLNGMKDEQQQLQQVLVNSGIPQLAQLMKEDDVEAGIHLVDKN